MRRYGKRIILVLSMILFSSILIAEYTLHVSTDQPEYIENEPIEISLKIVNMGDETLNLSFSCSPPNFYSINNQYFPEGVYWEIIELTLDSYEEHIYYSYIEDGLEVGEYSVTAGLHLPADMTNETEPIYIAVNQAFSPDVNVNSLYQLKNYPNPFNPETTIYFELVEKGPVTLSIYDMKGNHVKKLVDSFWDIGNHQVIWNGYHDDGSQAASGIYLYKLRSGRASSTKKMILMK